MRIGRFAFGIARGTSYWGYEHSSCGCYILDLGRLYFIFLGKNCKCGACGKYECVCFPKESA